MTIEKILTGQSQDHLIELDHTLMNKDIKQDFLLLQKAALKAGFDLQIASCFRDFERQLTIWNNKFTGKSLLLDENSTPLNPSKLRDEEKINAILRWSALPGASRHHWGTDMDVYAKNLLPQDTKLQLEPWEYHTGHQHSFYLWLKDHLSDFGFFFPYAKDNGGIAAEPWHISHLTTASIYQEKLDLSLLIQTIQQSSIEGKNTILPMLDNIYSRFITNICQPKSDNNQGIV